MTMTQTVTRTRPDRRQPGSPWALQARPGPPHFG